MGIFRRSPPTPGDEADSLSDLLLQGQDMMRQVEQAHQSWGFGTAARWDLDQTTGLITWTFPDRTASADAQILGSYSPGSMTWKWAWANPSILPAMSAASERVHMWAQQQGHTALTLDTIPADEDTVETLVAIAMRFTRATGLFRGPGVDVVTYVTFGDVTLTTGDGETSTFKISVDN